MRTTFTKVQIPAVAREVVELVTGHRSESATIVALSGDLGAGKTTLTQALAACLGVRDTLISPTFVIMKRYAISSGSYKNLIHIDAYRLTKESELENLGWKELIQDKENLIIIEWPEQVPGCVPENGVCKITLSHKDEETRAIEIVL